jgi:hypothetical protein
MLEVDAHHHPVEGRRLTSSNPAAAKTLRPPTRISSQVISFPGTVIIG